LIKKINVPLIITQILSLTLVKLGVTRIYYSYYSKSIEAVFSDEPERYEIGNEIGIEIILFYEAGVSFLAFFLLLISIFILNHKKNIHWINSIILFFLAIGLIISGFLYSSVVSATLNTFCSLFGEGFGTSNLIAGLLLFTIGVFILLNQYQKLRNAKNY
jgi:multisubunit Na+/H+ antiporter MnhC subunit